MRRRRLGIAIALITTLVVVWFALTRDRETLLARSKPVASTADWWTQVYTLPSGEAIDTGPVYQWISPHRLEILVNRQSTPNAITLAVTNRTAPRREHLLLDLPTGHRFHLSELGRPYSLYGGTPRWINPSPDGKAVRWNAGTQQHVAQMDGSYHHIWSLDSNLCWLDSGHLSEIGYKDGDTPFAVRIYDIRIPGHPDALILPKAALQWSNLRQCGAHLCNFRDNGNTVAISDVDLSARNFGSRLQEHTHSVPVPESATVEEIQFSPDGTRVAWLFKRRHDTLIGQLERRVFHRSPPVQETLELLVSKLDGSQMHLVGWMRYPVERPRPVYRGLKWLPGGRKLSFVYKKQLWVVPAD